MIDAVATHVSLLEYKLVKLLIFFLSEDRNLNFSVKFSNISALATNSNKKQNTHTYVDPHTSVWWFIMYHSHFVSSFLK